MDIMGAVYIECVHVCVCESINVCVQNKKKEFVFIHI